MVGGLTCKKGVLERFMNGAPLPPLRTTHHALRIFIAKGSTSISKKGDMEWQSQLVSLSY